MSDKIIQIDIDDPRTGKIAEAISNKTSKRILNALAENEMSESEISSEIGVPMNTVNYNVKKLVDAGLIEKTKGFLWSVKGKKIEKYRLANKKIVILPKKTLKGVLPAVIFSGIFALGVKLFNEMKVKSAFIAERDVDLLESGQVALKATSSDLNVSGLIATFAQNNWLWFLAGAFFSLLVFLVWNYISNKYNTSNRFEVKKGFK